MTLPRLSTLRRTPYLLPVLCLVVAPCAVTTVLHLMDWRQARAADQMACTAFANGQPGWQSGHDLQTQLDTLAAYSTAVAARSIAEAQDELSSHLQHLTPDTVRLHALPLGGQVNAPVFVGGHWSLVTALPHSSPGAGALYVDLPWQDGSYARVNLHTPCGEYEQHLVLTQIAGTSALLHVTTYAYGQLLSEQRLPLQR